MPKRQTGADTRDAILKAASELFAEHGYHGTSTRDIARAVDIKQPSLFTHFESKAAIMSELQRIGFEPSLRRLRIARTLDADPMARLYAALYVDVLRMIDSHYVISGSTSATALTDPAFAKGSAMWEEILSLQSRLVKDALADPRGVDAPPSYAIRALAWLFEGVIAQSPRDVATQPADIADGFASFVMSALLRSADDIPDVRNTGLVLAEQIAALENVAADAPKREPRVAGLG